MATATQRAEDADRSAGTGEVTLPQKMLSAVSGSVLTSLLGAYIILLTLIRARHIGAHVLGVSSS
jgi:solute carrier family 25 protein 39/40